MRKASVKKKAAMIQHIHSSQMLVLTPDKPPHARGAMRITRVEYIFTHTIFAREENSLIIEKKSKMSLLGARGWIAGDLKDFYLFNEP